MSRPIRTPILPLLMAALALITPSLLSAQQGGLLVAPTRLVFEGRTRGGEVTLVNSGTETTTYRIEVVRLRMREDGSFEDVVEPQAGERFANDLIRYSPRQVTLEPGVPQTVRVQLRLPAVLEEGEYRSHLLFRAIPPLREVDSGSVAEGVRVQLVALYGVTIPLVVRHGELQATVTVERFVIEPDGRAVTIHLRRQGDRSVYGDVHVARLDGTLVTRARGLAVYAPNAARTVRVPLPEGAGVTPQDGLRITFAERAGPDTGGTRTGGR